MRRIVAAATAALLSVSLFAPTSGAAPSGRTETKTYRITRGHIQFNSQEIAWMGTQAESFRPRSGEHSVTISLEDDSGNPVRGRVEVGSQVVEFCSETTKPIKVAGVQKIEVHVVFGPCDGGLSIVTEGTITATFAK